jgi:hypothetical protein
VSLICRTVPASWPAYDGLDGHQWRLDPNGFWWLRWGKQWHQAASLAAGDVLGVKVPPAILRTSRNWLIPQPAPPTVKPGLIYGTQTLNEAREKEGTYENLMAHHERQIASSFMIAPPLRTYPASGTGMLSAAGGAGGNSNSWSSVPNTVVYPAAELKIAPIAPPNIPPDFAEIPRGPGCCRECRLDDTPLYEGGLCRYCWMLTQVATPRSAPAAEQPRQQRSLRDPRYVATMAIVAVILLLAMYVAIFS